MFHKSTILVLIAMSSLVAFSNNGRESPKSSIIVNAWKAPPCTDYVNDDGLVYAAHYPTYAVVCRNLPEMEASDHRAAVTNATLFLIAGPQLNDSNLLESIPSSARFAIDCHDDARGHWVQFTPGSGTNEHLFLLVDHTGGNGCTDRIRIYHQEVDFYPSLRAEDNGCQNHTFREFYIRKCVNSPYLADWDGDGYPELLVLERVESGESEATAMTVYRVIKYLPEYGLRVVRELNTEEFEAIPDKIPL